MDTNTKLMLGLASTLIVLGLLAAGCTGSAKKTMEDCKKIPLNDVSRYVICSTEVAFADGNANACESFGTADEKKLCYESIANECSCVKSSADKYPAVCSAVKAKGVVGACE